ncbi:MAG: DUF6870 family protein [Mobilitalea sp.]
MKTVNTVIANLERIIKFSNVKEESNIYQYWKIGRELCFGNKLNQYGTHFIDGVAKGLQRKGFIKNTYKRRGLYRMQQFYKSYPDWQIFGSLLSEISWSNHILIVESIESEDKAFWLVLCVENHYTARQLKDTLKKWKAGVLVRPGNNYELIQISGIEGVKTHQKVTFDNRSYTIPTRDELENMKEVDILSICRDQSVDIKDIHINENLSIMEKTCSFLDQVKNPYCCRVGEVVVKCVFTEDGLNMDEIIGRDILCSQSQI